MDFYVLQPDGMMFGTKWAYGELIKPVNFGEAPMCPVCHNRPVASRAWLEPRKIRLSSSKPAKWGDLVWGAGFAFLMSGKMKHAYLHYELTGIETFLPPVEIYQAGKKASHTLPDLPLYYLVQIELFGANIHDIESEVLRKPHHCHYCRGDVISIKKVVGLITAMGNKQVGIIDNWLRHIKDVYRLHYDELQAIQDPKTRADRFVELNVIEQVLDLSKTSIVQNAWRSGQKLYLHGLVFDIANGYLKDLDVTMDDPDQLPSYYLLDKVAVVK